MDLDGGANIGNSRKGKKEEAQCIKENFSAGNADTTAHDLK